MDSPMEGRSDVLPSEDQTINADSGSHSAADLLCNK